MKDKPIKIECFGGEISAYKEGPGYRVKQWERKTEFEVSGPWESDRDQAIEAWCRMAEPINGAFEVCRLLIQADSHEQKPSVWPAIDLARKVLEK